MNPIGYNLSTFFLDSYIHFFGNSLIISTSTFNLAQLSLVLLLVVISTYRGLCTSTVIEKIVYFLNMFGGNDGNKIHTIAIVISSFGSYKGSHFRVLIG